MIDENVAPEGYIAAESIIDGLCTGCDFFPGKCPEAPCTNGLREDGMNVIFVKDARLATSVPATLLYPMGSCGEAIDAGQ